MRILGKVDHQYHRAPNATMGYIGAKVKASQNRTLEWLNKKNVQEQERLIFFVIKRGRDVRRIRKERERTAQGGVPTKAGEK